MQIQNSHFLKLIQDLRGIFKGGLSFELNVQIDGDHLSLTLISSSPIIYYTSGKKL